MNDEKLWDLHQLLENYPALKYHGVRWLVRNRRIPIVKIGKRVYFEPSSIQIWVNEHKVNAQTFDKFQNKSGK